MGTRPVSDETEFSKLTRIGMGDLFDQSADNLEVVLRAKIRSTVRAFRPTGTPQSIRFAFERVQEMLGRDPVLRAMEATARRELVAKLMRYWAS